MTDQYIKKAADLQTAGRITNADPQHYEDAAVRQATVHTREDTILLVSLLHSLNLQIHALRNSIWILAIVGIVLFCIAHFA